MCRIAAHCRGFQQLAYRVQLQRVSSGQQLAGGGLERQEAMRPSASTRAGEARTKQSGLPTGITSLRREVYPHGGWQPKLNCLPRHSHGEFSKPGQRRAVFTMSGLWRVGMTLLWRLGLDVRGRRG